MRLLRLNVIRSSGLQHSSGILLIELHVEPAWGLLQVRLHVRSDIEDSKTLPDILLIYSSVLFHPRGYSPSHLWLLGWRSSQENVGGCISASAISPISRSDKRLETHILEGPCRETEKGAAPHSEICCSKVA